MIENIVFDMGNVLILYSPLDFIRPLVSTPEDETALLHELFGSAEWLQMDRGLLTEAQAVQQVNKRLPPHLHSVCSQLCYEWHSNTPRYPEMETLLKALKMKGYKLFLLSNASKKLHEYRDKIPAMRYFDGYFISADYGLLKPDLDIYYAFYKEFSLQPEACFFIDDMPANIEAAAATGMQGHIFRRDIAALKQALSAAGIDL